MSVHRVKLEQSGMRDQGGLIRMQQNHVAMTAINAFYFPPA
jgi:hypothetical protein